MLRKKHYTHIMVVVHGYSELRLAEFVKSTLRIPLEIVSNRNGSLPYQITDLVKLFGKSCDFNSGFRTKYKEKIEFKNRKPLNLKIFTIMDQDDTPNDIYQMYKSGRLLKKSNGLLGSLIIPIFNEENLEEVLKDVGWDYAKPNMDKGKIYLETFPTIINYDQTRKNRIEQLEIKLENCPITNMEKFLKACLEEQNY